jgi:hypothetical protein
LDSIFIVKFIESWTGYGTNDGPVYMQVIPRFKALINAYARSLLFSFRYSFLAPSFFPRFLYLISFRIAPWLLFSISEYSFGGDGISSSCVSRLLHSSPLPFHSPLPLLPHLPFFFIIIFFTLTLIDTPAGAIAQAEALAVSFTNAIF